MKPHPIDTRRADALERVVETYLAGEKGERPGGDRYLVNIHTKVDTLTANGAGAESECKDCGHVSAETSRRMACDASVVHWHEAKDGEPLNIGRKSRSIPPAIRRAIKRRLDQDRQSQQWIGHHPRNPSTAVDGRDNGSRLSSIRDAESGMRHFPVSRF